MTKEINRGSPDFLPIKPTDYGRFLVISLGTGSPKTEEKYDALKSGRWGLLGWLTAEGSTPLIDVFMQSSSDMVDFHISTVFQALHSEDKYLRIQVNFLMHDFQMKARVYVNHMIVLIMIVKLMNRTIHSAAMSLPWILQPKRTWIVS